MTRTAAREIAILLGFSAVSGGETAQERLDRFFEPEHYASMAEENPLFAEYPDAQQMDYIRTLVGLIAERRETLDAYIEKYARGWKADRISKTAGAVLRCAMSEILWLPEVPNAAAINEAVELAKKYEDEDTVSFINGILGGFVRGEVEKEET
jgi:N utilization substance protein B